MREVEPGARGGDGGGGPPPETGRRHPEDHAESGDPEAELKSHALEAFGAALAAVDPEALVRDALSVGTRDPPPETSDAEGAGETGEVRAGAPGRLLVVAVGKAAPAMARGALAAVERPPDEAVILTVRGTAQGGYPGFRVYEGGHPLPDEAGVAATRAIREMVSGLGESDTVLLLLSGGGSALLTLPAADVPFKELRRTTAALLEAGAAIEELNAVRKHLEVLKGGGLAAATAPARLRALVLSDVVGDRLDVIASGPVSPDPDSFADALAVLERYGPTEERVPAVWRRLRAGRDGEVAETAKEGDPAFRRVQVEVVGNAALAAAAAAREAEALGFPSEVVTTEMTGEAREVGARIASELLELPAPACRVWAGETTVTVTGPGRGGRSQELALGAARVLEGARGRVVLAAGTDGIDGSTDAAGAVASGRTVSRAVRKGLDPARALERNDSYRFFRALDDLVVTGPTGTNVMDLVVGLGVPGPHTEEV